MKKVLQKIIPEYCWYVHAVYTAFNFMKVVMVVDFMFHLQQTYIFFGTI